MAKTKKAPQSTTEIFLENKVAHHSDELESAVLGALMLEDKAMMTVARIIKHPDVFYSEANQKIFTAIQQLYVDLQPIDILTVTDVLRKKNELEIVGGAYYVTELTNNVASSAHIQKHSHLLWEYWLRRNLALLYAKKYLDVIDDSIDIFETFDDTILKLEAIKMQLVSMQEFEFSEQVDETMRDIISEMNGKNLPISTGFRNVDHLTGGRVNGELGIIAGQTSMGKTVRMLKEVMNVALTENKEVGVISLETKSKTLIRKMLSNLARVDSKLFRSRELSLYDLDHLENARQMLRDYNIHIHDMSGINISDVKAIARKWKAQRGIKILYIDYLTLIKSQNPFTKSMVEEVTKISHGLKELTMELDIPIVACAQINRNPAGRADKRPTMADLRESGAIENDADVISLLYRPEYYGEMLDMAGNSLVGVMEERIPKNKNGVVGVAYHRFIPAIADFEPLGFEPYFGEKNTASNSTSQSATNGVSAEKDF